MPDPNEKIKVLYDAVSKDYSVGTFDEFKTKLSDPSKRKALYEGVSEQYDLGTFDEFESKIGFKKKVGTDSPTISKGFGPSTSVGGQDYFKFDSRVNSEVIKSGVQRINKAEQDQAIAYAEFRKKQRESDIKAATDMFGKVGGKLAEYGHAIYNQVGQNVVNIPAQISDWVGMAAKNIENAYAKTPIILPGYYSPSKPNIKTQGEYGTTQAAKEIRDFSRLMFPVDPGMQDNLAVQVFGAAPLMLTGMGIGMAGGGALGATTLWSTTMGGDGFRDAYDRFTDYKTLSVEENIQKYAQNPEDAEIIKKHVGEVKNSEEAPEDMAMTHGWVSTALGSAESLPVLKYFKLLDKYSGGAVKKSIFSKAANNIANSKFLKAISDSRAGKITQQGIEEAIQEVTTNGLQNLSAKATYDRTRKMIDGTKENGLVGGILGATTEALLGHHVKRRGTFNNPKEEAINEAAIAQLEKEKAEYDANPEAAKPASEEKSQLLGVLDSDVSDETRKLAAEKLDALDNKEPDTSAIRQEVKASYDAKIQELDADAAKAPEALKADIEERKKQLFAELDDALAEVGKPKTPTERLLDSENLPAHERAMANMSPEGFMEYVAQQAQGFGQDWSAFDTDAAKAMQGNYSPKLIREAVKMFPAKKFGKSKAEVASEKTEEKVKLKPDETTTEVKVEPDIPKRQTQVNALIDKIASFNKLAKNASGRSQELNKLRLAANDLGLKFDDRAGKLLNAKGNVVQKRSPDAGAKPVKDFDENAYSEETKGYIEIIKADESALVGLGVTGPDGRAMSRSQLASAVEAMRSGKPTNGSKAVYDFIEDADGVFDLEDKLSGQRVRVTAKEYFDTFKAPVQELTDAEIEALEWEPDEDYFKQLEQEYEQERISEETERTPEGSAVEDQAETSGRKKSARTNKVEKPESVAPKKDKIVSLRDRLKAAEDAKANEEYEASLKPDTGMEFVEDQGKLDTVLKSQEVTYRGKSMVADVPARKKHQEIYAKHQNLLSIIKCIWG